MTLRTYILPPQVQLLQTELQRLLEKMLLSDFGTFLAHCLEASSPALRDASSPFVHEDFLARAQEYIQCPTPLHDSV